MATTTDIVAKLWGLCNVLRDDGVTYNEYVTELTYLLFLKMLQETGKEDRLPKQYRWAKWQSLLHPLFIAVFGITVLGITSAVLESLYGLISVLATDTNWR